MSRRFLATVVLSALLLAAPACNAALGEGEGALPVLATLAPVEPTAAPNAGPGLEFLPGVSTGEESIGAYMGRYDVATSSHRVNDNRSISVDSACAVDGDLNTAWNTNDRTEGEWIELSVRDGRSYRVGGIRIANGYWKSDSVYRNNARLRGVEVYCDGEFVQSFELADARDLQTLRFDAPVTCSRVMLKIASGYPGARYRDCCITEIDLIGPEGTEVSSAAISDWGRAVDTLARRVTGGGSVAQGDKGYAVAGLQLLLRDAFGALDGSVDGDYGSGTRRAVDALAEEMRAALGSEALPMLPGTVDASYWSNLLAYMDRRG